MHIAIEATRLLRERRGIGRYVRRLLQTMPLERPEVRYTLYARSRDCGALRDQIASTPIVAERSTVAPLNKLEATDADLSWHAWNWIMYPTAAPMVVSIMDLVPMLQFDHKWWKIIRRQKARYRSMRTIQRASGILAISEFTASEVTRLLGVQRNRICVTLLGADDFPGSVSRRSETVERLGIEGPFFLAVGAQEARKNLTVLLQAMQRLNSERGPGLPEIPLVLCGPGDRLAGLASTHRASWLRFAGYVDDNELHTLYARATALIFPSLYEGFGLPVLEGMSAGAPVICANASSLPEVGGDAVLYFEPTDANDLLRQMNRLLTDDSLRPELLSRIPSQLSKFSWQRCSAETLRCFDDVLRASLTKAHTRRVE